MCSQGWGFATAHKLSLPLRVGTGRAPHIGQAHPRRGEAWPLAVDRSDARSRTHGFGRLKFAGIRSFDSPRSTREDAAAQQSERLLRAVSRARSGRCSTARADRAQATALAKAKRACSDPRWRDRESSLRRRPMQASRAWSPACSLPQVHAAPHARHNTDRGWSTRAWKAGEPSRSGRCGLRLR